jgi:hypothetical protein
MATELASARPARLDAGFASARRARLSIKRIFAEPAGLIHIAGTALTAAVHTPVFVDVTHAG